MNLMEMFFFCFSDSLEKDHRMPIVSHLADDLRKHLNQLENLYSTVTIGLIQAINSCCRFSFLDFSKFR